MISIVKSNLSLPLLIEVLRAPDEPLQRRVSKIKQKKNEKLKLNNLKNHNEILLSLHP